MPALPIPTIKGMFVKSHVNAVRRERGEAGVRELQERFGKPLDFGALQDVPLRDEVTIIEHALDLLSETPIPPDQRAFEAGRLHFRNFRTTSYGSFLLTALPHDYKMLMLRAPSIASHVFRNVRFNSEDLGPTSVRLIMENNDYPIDHFRGFFTAWMQDYGLDGNVEAKKEADRYTYTMTWKADQ
jgi:uncharacterized protein (TIGR02265 family)